MHCEYSNGVVAYNDIVISYQYHKGKCNSQCPTKRSTGHCYSYYWPQVESRA